MAGNSGIVLNAAGGDALAFLMDRERSGRAVKALRDGLAGLRQDAAAAGRALSQAAGTLKGITSALMHSANLAQALDKGLSSLYRWGKGSWKSFAATLDSLASSALYLRNSFAAMAAPLINAVAPAISFVTDKLVNLFNLVGALVARFSGAETYVAARKTADAWDSVGGRISRASSALRRYISGFDQLNVLQSDAASGGSGGGGGVGELFETRSIESGLAAFADQLRAAFESGDWAGLGTLLGEKVNAIVDSVDWAALGQKTGYYLNGAIQTAHAFLDTVNFTNIGASIAKYLNNALAGIDFSRLGGTVALFFTSAVETFAGFVSKFDWGQFAAKAAEAVNGFAATLGAKLDAIDWAALAKKLTAGVNTFIARTDWPALGATLGGRVNDLFTVLGTAAANFDWKGAGKALADGVNGMVRTVDWAAVGRWLNDTLSGLLDFGISFFQGFDAQGFASGIGKALEQVDWPALAAKLWSLLQTALSKLGEAAQTLLFGGKTDVSVGIGLLQNGWNTLKAWIEGKSGGDAMGLVGLLRSGWTLVSNWVGGFMGSGVNQNVGLARSAWSTVSAWVSGLMGSTSISQNVGLARNAWSTVSAWVGGLMGNTSIKQDVGLKKLDWASVSKWVSGLMGSTSVKQDVGLKKLDWSSVSKWVGGLMGSASVKQEVGLKKLDWSSVSKWVSGLMGSTSIKQDVGLKKLDWSSVSKWVSGLMGNTSVKQGVDLKKDGWSTVGGKFGSSLTSTTTYVSLSKNGTNWSSGLLQWITGNSRGTVTATINLVAGAVTGFAQAITKIFFKAGGGIITAAGRSLGFASGGMITGGGRPNWFSSVQKYAAGTSRAHGTLFAAGEAGPEIIGHINGRTEILNKSQLAQTMYSAVSAGMLAALSKVRFRMPAMATGAVLPYEIAAQIARTGEAIEDTLNANNEDLIQVIISTIGAQTSALVAALQALRAGGEGGMTARQVIEEINRRTQMFGASPIM